MKTAEIRRCFLDFFARHEHAIVPSASLLYNDPTLLFVNAGMVPFKNYFTGVEPAPYKRAASVQKCVRTLDIDDVGKTTRHGTFFQMAGNFSFADYFKAEAIQWGWDLVTGKQSEGGFGFDPEQVWVTILGGGYHPAYPDGDVEAYDLWRQVGVPAERIQSRDLKDNYWSMGVPGPGGPCSEIYIDRGPEFGPDGGPAVDEDRFLEIWNLVFQTEELSEVRAKDDFTVARTLPTKNIDTGLGLERVAFLLQAVDNMYEIDEVFPVIAATMELTGRRYDAGHHDDDVRMRVVADHVRSSLMLLTDGVAPGNEGRGYVLRRLLRRSVRAMRMLGVSDPVLPALLPVSRDVMKASYPEIEAQWARVSTLAYAEEEAFLRTLSDGTKLFEGAVAEVRQSSGSRLSGDKAFQLHDTYGFPIDVTMEMAAEQGIDVDAEGFRTLMAEQKARAKADAKLKKGGLVSTQIYADLRSEGDVRFLGYTDLAASSRIRGLIKDGAPVAQAKVGDTVELVLEETPFYAESGGQDADHGVISGAGFSIDVVDVQKPVAGLIVHRGVITDGAVETGMEATAAVDAPARFGSCQAHTATHIIHAVLRHTLGPTATQAGSYNKPGYLRFDFSSVQGLSDDLKAEIEGLSNQAIRDELAVSTSEMPLDEAKALGAMAMFGEKYGSVVRMVEMGGPWSRELCGGTHVAHSGQIGLLTLLGEQSIGSGTRRVEALVSGDAFSHLAAERAIVENLTGLVKARPDQLVDRVSALLAQVKQAEKTIAEFNAREAARQAETVTKAATKLGAVVFAGQVVTAAGSELRPMATQARSRLEREAAVVCLVGVPEAGAKPSVVVATTAAARDLGLKAGDLVKVATEAMGGRGGGKDDLAQGGGADASLAQAAVDAVAQAISGKQTA
ncbi:MAG: alanine--tRNA ligase [Propionibacteriaceae bacterium]|jgi:alanyl-tRNA synthetase|nr:alanine--tRNA ligase [Propionibacteriaceae bacterium]